MRDVTGAMTQHVRQESLSRRGLRPVGRSFSGCLAVMVGLLCLLSSDRALGADGKAVFWVIPHTHWEGAVFYTREEYLEMGLPHILTALRLLKEHPDYRFALDQVAYFRPFLERYPEEADAFKKFVAEGRLEIVCGLDVMPDDNMPSGESFVRQILYAKGYCRDVLGVEVKTGWLLDTFGHHAQMPQILRLAGYDTFWFARGVADRRKMPSDFLWQGLDGTRIRAFWLPFSYGNVFGPPRDFAGFSDFMKKRYDELAPFTGGALDRLGMDGADVTDPELYLPALMEQFNRQPNQPFTLRFGTPKEFAAVTAKRTDLPVVTGERNPLFQGVYSSRIELKERMRETERLLTTAEKFGALANWLGGPVDPQMIWRAWEPALFNVTHDQASGVMMDHVYVDAVRSYDFSQRLADEMIASRQDTVLARIDSRGDGVALAVFNTLGWPRTDVAEADVGFAQGGVNDFELRDASGKLTPSQLLDAEHYEDGGFRRVKFAFVARGIPALGFSLYKVLPLPTAGESRRDLTVTNQNGLLDNDYYRAGFDVSTGALTNLIVKAGDWPALRGPANVVAVQPDKGDFWELNKTLDGGQNVIMTRPLPVPQAGEARFSTEQTATNAVVLRGPVFSEIHVEHPFGSNFFATTARLYHGIPRIDFTTRILNNETFVRYRLLVPTAIKNGRNFQEIPFGAIERPNAQEFPAQNWIDYSDGERGVALINRGLPGNNVADGTMMLSLLRSTRVDVYWGIEAQRSNTGLELGKELTFHYALEPHAGDWRTAGVYRTGLEFNNPLIVRKMSSHSGSLPKTWGLLEVSPANVVLSALKPAKDGMTVIRIYEASGQATTGATIKLHAKVLSANEANLMEDSGAKVKVSQHTLQFDLHPFEIKTFKVRLGSAK
jgi:alpha-mannosidase